MKVYIINLDNEKKRWNAITDNYISSGINKEDIVRIPAIYGKELSISEKKKVCTEKGFKYCTNSMIGIFLSHQKAWRTFLESGEEYCIITEDDVKITVDTKKKLDMLFLDINDYDFDIMILSYTIGGKPPKDYIAMDTFFKIFYKLCGFKLQKYKYISNDVIQPEFFTGLQLYIISKKGANALLYHLNKVSYHIDVAISGNPYIKKLSLQNIYTKHVGWDDSSNNIGSNTQLIPNIKYNGIDINWVLNMPICKLHNIKYIFSFFSFLRIFLFFIICFTCLILI